MARRTVTTETTEPGTTGYVTDDRSLSTGVLLGILIAAAIVLIAILAATGVFSNNNKTSNNPGITNNNTNNAPSSAPQNDVPSAPAAAS